MVQHGDNHLIVSNRENVAEPLMKYLAETGLVSHAGLSPTTEAREMDLGVCMAGVRAEKINYQIKCPYLRALPGGEQPSAKVVLVKVYRRSRLYQCQL